jgi:hypothetical protein
LADAFERKFWRGRSATLIQDQEHTRNLDSKSHLLGFPGQAQELPGAVSLAAQFVSKAWLEILAVADVLRARQDLDEHECEEVVSLLAPRVLLG